MENRHLVVQIITANESDSAKDLIQWGVGSKQINGESGEYILVHSFRFKNIKDAISCVENLNK